MIFNSKQQTANIKHISFLFLLIFVTLQSCSKQESLESENRVEDLSILRESNPLASDGVSLFHDMLEFEDYQSYLKAKENLRELTEDTEFYNSKLLASGFDASIEDQHEPTNILTKDFSALYGHSSLLNKQEKDLFEYLNAGKDPSEYPAISFDDYTATMLNEFKEILINDLILVAIDEVHTAIIFNRNYEAAQSIRGLSFDKVKSEGDIFLYNPNDPRQNGINLFDEEDAFRSAFCFSRLRILSQSGNTVQFDAFVFPFFCTTEDLTFAWNFGDGSTFLGKNPPAHTYDPAGYPYTVTLVISSPKGCCNQTKKIQVFGECDAYFELSQVQGNVLDFQIYQVNTEATYFWDFGDGNTLTSSGFSNLPAGTVRHAYDINGLNDFTVTLTVSINGNTCSKSIVVTTGCGFKNKTMQDNRNFDVGNRTWRIEGKLWSRDNVIERGTGAHTKSYRRGLGIWWQRKADKLEVSAEGSFFTVSSLFGPDICGEAIIDKEKTSYNVNKVQVSHDGGGHMFLNNEVTSFHKVTENGVSRQFELELVKD